MRKYARKIKTAGVVLIPLLVLVLFAGLCRVDVSAAGSAENKRTAVLKNEAAAGDSAAAKEGTNADGTEEPEKINYFRLIMFVLSPFIIFGFGIVGIIITNKYVQKKQRKKMSDTLVQLDNEKNGRSDQDKRDNDR